MDGGGFGGEYCSIMEGMLMSVTISSVLNSSRGGDGPQIWVGVTNKEFWFESLCFKIAGGLGGDTGRSSVEPGLVCS